MKGSSHLQQVPFNAVRPKALCRIFMEEVKFKSAVKFRGDCNLDVNRNDKLPS